MVKYISEDASVVRLPSSSAYEVITMFLQTHVTTIPHSGICTEFNE